MTATSWKQEAISGRWESRAERWEEGGKRRLIVGHSHLQQRGVYELTKLRRNKVSYNVLVLMGLKLILLLCRTHQPTATATAVAAIDRSSENAASAFPALGWVHALVDPGTISSGSQSQLAEKCEYGSQGLPFIGYQKVAAMWCVAPILNWTSWSEPDKAS